MNLLKTYREGNNRWKEIYSITRFVHPNKTLVVVQVSDKVKMKGSDVGNRPKSSERFKSTRDILLFGYPSKGLAINVINLGTTLGTTQANE